MRPWCSVILAGVVLAVPVRGLAQTDTAAAQELFEQGRALLKVGKAGEACPKLAESHRLDPATGTLLALAMCHEQEGKLASAWAEFTEVQGRARRDARQDRQQLAKERAAALRPRLSTLTIEVPPSAGEVSGFELRRNGVPIGAAFWNTPVPVDGGLYTIDATAPGKRPARSDAAVKPERDRVRVVVPVLADVPRAEAAPPLRTPNDSRLAGHDRTLTRGPAPNDNPWGATEWAGVAIGGAGVVSAGVGGYFLATALQRFAQSKNDCAERCGTQGLADRAEAVKRGNIATVLGVGAGVLIAGGATLLIVGRSGSPARQEAPLAVSLDASPTGMSAALRGTF